MVIGEGGLRVAVDASEGNLARGGLEGRYAVAFGALGGLDVELGPVEEELVALEVRAVGSTPGGAANVVDVARVANGQDEGGGLDVVKLLDVAGEDVHHGVRDAREDDAFNVTVLDGVGDLLLQPCRELVVAEIADRHKGAIRQGQGALVGDISPVTGSYEGGDGL